MISNVYVNERHRNPHTLDCILCKQRQGECEGAAFVTECNLFSCSRYSKSSGWEDIHFPFIWRQIKEKYHNISRTSTRTEGEFKTTRKMIFFLFHSLRFQSLKFLKRCQLLFCLFQLWRKSQQSTIGGNAPSTQCIAAERSGMKSLKIIGYMRSYDLNFQQRRKNSN